MSDCLFCKILAHTIPADILYEDDAVTVFLDIAPVRPGHALFVPKEHAERLEENSPAAATALITTVQRLAPKIVAAVGGTGWNMQANSGADAGQVIAHTHLHVIPRTADDGLQLWHGEAMDPAERQTLIARIREHLV